MSRDIAIPHIAWRNGRPRFSPSKSLRAAGHKGHDLKQPDGGWMTWDECRAWSAALSARLAGDRQQKVAKKARQKAAVKKQAAAQIPAAPKKRALTLGQLLEDFSSNGMAGNAAGTVKNYRTQIRNIEADAPHAWLSDAEALTRTVTILLYDTWLKTRGVHTSRQMIRVLSVCWNWGLDRGKVTTPNPVFRIKTLDPAPRVRAMSIGEYLHLVETAEAMGHHQVADMIVWGVWTAQRMGDRLAMQQQNLRDGRLELTQEKTSADVSIRMAVRLADRWRQRRHNGRFLIPDVSGDTPKNRQQNYRRIWQAVRDQAAMTMPSVADLNDQDFRDTAISWMGRAGCTPHQVFAITGHRQQGETRILRHYMAVHNDIADAAIAKLEAWFEQELKKLEGEQG